jgi:hypothetical protein
MFDQLRCRYPLPVEGYAGRVFQTKDTPAQFLDKYEIRADGTLWHEAYDTEDHSKPGSARAMQPRVNKRWEPVPFNGQIRFRAWVDPEWIGFLACFVDGRIAPPIQLIERRGGE